MEKKDTRYIKGLENVARKVQIYLKKYNLSMLQFSGFFPTIKYQTLKRMGEYDYTNSAPNITSLNILANFFGWNIAELLSDEIMINIEVYDSLSEAFAPNKLNATKIKAYIPLDLYESRQSIDLFAIKSDDNLVDINTTDKLQQEPIEFIKLFIKVSSVEYEGLYLTELSNTIRIIDVVSASSHSIMVNENGAISSISLKSVKVIAKLFKSGIYIKLSNSVVIY